jgi:selenocysteine lyase/cysteine desulfurase
MKSFFQLDEHIIHLNHAAVAPWPVVTRDTIIEFAKENAAVGSQHYDKWLQTEHDLKQKLARLINARWTDEIALLKNTSEGLSLIAQGLSFEQGDNIVIPAEEFPSNKVVWQALTDEGVECRMVEIQDSDDPEQVLIDAMDERTRLLSCSSVQFARGLRLDLDRIGESCRANGTLFCVDAIQSLGAISFDVESCQADFVVADGHKWMCAPEGTALFFCRKEIQGRLSLRQHGWHMLKDAFDFTRSDAAIRVADSAQRFECGSPNMMGIAALDASLGLLLDIGIDTIESGVIDNANYLFTELACRPDLRVLTKDSPDRFAGIVTFEKKHADNTRLYQVLQESNVLCANRGGGIRFSPHFYTERRSIDKALEVVDGFSE